VSVPPEKLVAHVGMNYRCDCGGCCALVEVRCVIIVTVASSLTSAGLD